MKFNRLVVCFIIILMAAITVSAEPLTIEQAPNVLEKGQFELGFEAAFGMDEYKTVNNPGVDYTRTTGSLNLFTKYGFSSDKEMLIRVPYVWWDLKTKTAATTVSNSENGIGDFEVFFKHVYNPADVDMIRMGIALGFSFPTGKEEDFLGAGFDWSPRLIFSRIFGRYMFDLNMGYDFRGYYYDETGVEIDPGDAYIYGVSVGRPLADCYTLLAEVSGETFKEERYNNTKILQTDGTRVDLIPGIRYHKGSLKAKFGFAVALGSETSRLYDWKVITGVSYLFNI